MPYKDVTYPIHRHRSAKIYAEIDAEVFGSGFIHLKQVHEENGRYEFRTILIDPGDIENLEVALKEAKRRRNASARRRYRKLALEGVRVG